jgi:hypothetical protein
MATSAPARCTRSRKSSAAPPPGADHAGQRARHPLAGLLGADRRGHGKYVSFIMRADNKRRGRHHGADGAGPADDGEGRTAPGLLIALGLFGAALFYGDGVITPAISVLSAVEGLEVITPALQALHHSDHAGHPVRAVLHPAPRHGQRRRAVRSGHDALVRHAGRARRHQPSCSTRRAGGAQSGSLRLGNFLLANPVLGFFALGAVVPGHHRRRGAVCRHGPLRRKPIQPAWFGYGAAGPDAQLFRPGRAAAGRPGGASRTRSTCWRRTGRSIRWSPWPRRRRSSPRRR